jgi:eukaryotic-like serine/threonine-protein kinase
MAGQYQIERSLGRGGMGEVYSAIHPLIGKRVALKVIRSDKARRAANVERFVQEARAANLIGHPNIVDVFGFGTLADGRPYLAMELLEGETLRECMQRSPMPLPDVLHVVDGILCALHAAHKQGIVHRDLKPENVFLVARKDSPAQVKLLDFGLAKLTDERDLRADRTETGAVMGTPRYLAPEQAAGKPVEARTDLYALGVMLFEMLTGQPPFIGSHAMEVVAQHLTTPAPRASSIAPEIPKQLDDLVAALMAKTAEERPNLSEVREVRKALLQLPRLSAGSRRWIPGLLAAVALAAAGLWFRDEAKPKAPTASGAVSPAVASPAEAPKVTPAPPSPSPSPSSPSPSSPSPPSLSPPSPSPPSLSPPSLSLSSPIPVTATPSAEPVAAPNRLRPPPATPKKRTISELPRIIDPAAGAAPDAQCPDDSKSCSPIQVEHGSPGEPRFLPGPAVPIDRVGSVDPGTSPPVVIEDDALVDVYTSEETP